MYVHPIRTDIINQGDSIESLLKQSVQTLAEQSIVVITSKVISLSQCRTVAKSQIDKQTLIEQEAEWYLPTADTAKSRVTITYQALMLNAGIDQIDASQTHVLLPIHLQETANSFREFLATTYGLNEIGVIVTDTSSRPTRRGTTGLCLAHSGFVALKRYSYRSQSKVGEGLVDRYTQSNHADGLAAAAVVAMGEGQERTPIAIISELPFVEFQPRNPTPEELAELQLDMEKDMYAPLLAAVTWRRGQGLSK